MSKPIGEAGLYLIKTWEGCRLKAYKPVSTEQYWTIGWGHYGPDVKEGQTITQEQADAMLLQDCQRYADAVDNPAYVPLTAQLNANQRDALISFAYNCGVSSLRTLCRDRTLDAIAKALPLYVKAGGKTLLGLVRRRAAEQELFYTPVDEEDEEVVYKYLKDVPAKFQPIISTLMTAGIIQGDGSDPVGNGDVINLTHEQVRTLIFVYRGGGFNETLRARNLPTDLS